MKKVFAILLAMAALGMIVSGCQKKEEGGGETPAAGADEKK